MKRQKSAGIFMLIFGIVFVFAGFFMAGFFIYSDQDYRFLMENGTPIQAVIDNRNIDTSTDSDGDTSYTYYIHYQYLAGTHQVGATKSISQSYYNTLRTGDKIDIKYDPAKHEHNIIIADKPLDSMIGILFGLIFILPGLLVAVLGVRQLKKYNWLIKNGISSEAEVLEVQTGNMVVNDVKQIQIRVKFKEYQGLSDNLDPKSLQVKAGDKVNIKYNPKNPKEFILV